jgi:hypothetical protein
LAFGQIQLEGYLKPKKEDFRWNRSWTHGFSWVGLGFSFGSGSGYGNSPAGWHPNPRRKPVKPGLIGWGLKWLQNNFSLVSLKQAVPKHWAYKIQKWTGSRSLLLLTVCFNGQYPVGSVWKTKRLTAMVSLFHIWFLVRG